MFTVEELAKQTRTEGIKTLVVWLSDEEYAELRRAVSEAALPNLSLLIFRAIQTGLTSDEAHGLLRKRTRTVSIHVSREFMERIRSRARVSRVSQQALMRSLLFHYIRSKAWQPVEENHAKETKTWN